MSLIKLALNIPISHLKGDAKEINEIREAAKKIVKITKEMNKEDKKAMKKTASSEPKENKSGKKEALIGLGAVALSAAGMYKLRKYNRPSNITKVENILEKHNINNQISEAVKIYKKEQLAASLRKKIVLDYGDDNKLIDRFKQKYGAGNSVPFLNIDHKTIKHDHIKEYMNQQNIPFNNARSSFGQLEEHYENIVNKHADKLLKKYTSLLKRKTQ